MSALRPMDPERLTDLREGLDWNRGNPDAPPVPVVLVEELLADRDLGWATAQKNRGDFLIAHSSACEAHRQLKRFRACCLVQASDVKAAGVTLPGHARPWMKREQRREPDCVNVGASSIAAYINAVAKAVGRSAFVVLDEMASMPQEQS